MAAGFKQSDTVAPQSAAGGEDVPPEWLSGMVELDLK